MKITENKKNNYYKWLFLIAGSINILSVIMVIFFYPILRQISGIDTIYGAIWPTLCLGFIFVFGIGYILISVDIKRNYAIAILGIIGKLFVFITFLIFSIQKIIPPGIIIAAAPDLIFAILFIEYLRYIQKVE